MLLVTLKCLGFEGSERQDGGWSELRSLGRAICVHPSDGHPDYIPSLLFSSHPRLRQNLDTEQELDLSVMSVHARILELSLPVAFELLRFDASPALSGSNGRCGSWIVESLSVSAWMTAGCRLNSLHLH